MLRENLGSRRERELPTAVMCFNDASLRSCLPQRRLKIVRISAIFPRDFRQHRPRAAEHYDPAK